MTPAGQNARHVVLVEPHWGGHQSAYLRLFSLSLLQQGHRVSALCPQPAEPTEWLQSRYPDLAGRFGAFAFTRPSPVAPDTRWPARRFALKFWRETADAIARHGIEPPSLVFLSWLDTYLHPSITGLEIDRVFPHPWSGLYFFPGEHRGTGAHRGLSRAALAMGVPFRGRRCRGVAVLDEIALAPLGRALTPRPAVRFPDLTDETPPSGSPLAARVRAAAKKRAVIASVGALSKRKGIYELIQICERSQDRPWFFVFGGKLDLVDFDDRAVRDIVRFVQHPPANALVHLQLVPDGNEFNSLVAAADVLYCHYLQFPHSSNLLTKAALLRRPVLVSDRHCMAERVARHRLGAAAREGDIDAITRALHDVLQQPREDGRDFAGYFERHAASALADPFATLLAQAGDGRSH